MSDCFFDLLVPAIRVRAWATKPGAETKLMAEEIIMSYTQRNVCDAVDYACADLEASSLLSELNFPRYRWLSYGDSAKQFDSGPFRAKSNVMLIPLV
jgi:hypothetical protein